MTVLNPCDAVEVGKMVKAAVSHQGPVYIRINRNDLPVYTQVADVYQIGKIYPLREGTDAAIFATGVMVWKAMEAAELLEKDGISTQVLNVSTLKPLPPEEVLRYARGKKAVVTAEEAVKTGGLGQAIASLILGKTTVSFEQVAIDDRFGTSAHNYEELLTAYGLGAQDVYRAVKKALGG
jgi:transketolase